MFLTFAGLLIAAFIENKSAFGFWPLVTAGECAITVNGRPEALGEGDAVIIPPGTSHAISHDSGEPCRVIAVLASADARVGTTK